ncbi:RidA family protein [Bosea vestrisii]|uniref:RidA family protein n=1 Tax=Bosea vestrisii TaxID=151416 RepID=A0ABW0HC90_9HYPH
MMIDRFRTGPRMSKIVRCSDLIFLSGQTSSGTSLADIVGQTREVLRRIDELLVEAGSDKSRLLSVTIYLRDMNFFGAMNAEWEAWLPEGAAPARATVEARMASPDLLVEMSVIAATQIRD